MTDTSLESAEKTPTKTEVTAANITADETVNIDHSSENEDKSEPQTVNVIDSSNLDKKAKIAAAVAKAKAKKLAAKSQQTSDTQAGTISATNESDDKQALTTEAASAANKKARIAAAVAKAKAKKLAASSDKSPTSE